MQRRTLYPRRIYNIQHGKCVIHRILILRGVYLIFLIIPDYGNSLGIPLSEPNKAHDGKCMLKPITHIQYTVWEVRDSQDTHITWCVLDISH